MSSLLRGVDRSQVMLLVLDKLVLASLVGVAAVVAGSMLTAKIQEKQQIREYQKILFERRLDAYEKLLNLATTVRLQITSRDEDAMLMMLVRKARQIACEAERVREKEIATGKRPGRSGYDLASGYGSCYEYGSYGISDGDPTPPSLWTLITLRRFQSQERMYISSPVASALDTFVRDAAKVINDEMTAQKGERIGRKAGIDEAFQRLEIEVSKALRLDQIILGAVMSPRMIVARAAGFDGCSSVV